MLRRGFGTIAKRSRKGSKKNDSGANLGFEQKLTDGADEVFVNGDSFIPNAKALDPVFKGRMFAEAQA